MMAKDDPFITHKHTATQLVKQVHKESASLSSASLDRKSVV